MKLPDKREVGSSTLPRPIDFEKLALQRVATVAGFLFGNYHREFSVHHSDKPDTSWVMGPSAREAERT
jgi:hypothetical protein